MVGERLKNHIRKHAGAVAGTGSAQGSPEVTNNPKKTTAELPKPSASVDESTVVMTGSTGPGSEMTSPPSEKTTAAAAGAQWNMDAIDFDKELAVLAQPGKWLAPSDDRKEEADIQFAIKEAFSDPHILSIQSHVCRDYVGNRAGALCLQLLGHDVDVINTVEFASMYVHEGCKHEGPQITEWWEGIVKAIEDPKSGGHPGAAARMKIPSAVLNDAAARPPEFPDDDDEPVSGQPIKINNNNFGVPFEAHDIPVLLSGYAGTASGIEAIGAIADWLKNRPCKAWPYVSVNERLQYIMSPSDEPKRKKMKEKLRVAGGLLRGGQQQGDVSPSPSPPPVDNVQDSRVCMYNTLRPSSSGSLFVCDPAMGDNGRLYVSPDCKHAYADIVGKFADIVTPNHFELGWLIESVVPFARTPEDPLVPFESLVAVHEAINVLHRGGCDVNQWTSQTEGVSMVVVTSTHFSQIGHLLDALFFVASLEVLRADNVRERHACIIPFRRLPSYRGGSGDAFTSLLTDRITKCSRARFMANKSQQMSTAELADEFRDIMRDTLCLMQILLVRNELINPEGIDVKITKLGDVIRRGVSSSTDKRDRHLVEKIFQEAKFACLSSQPNESREAFEARIGSCLFQPFWIAQLNKARTPN